VFVQDEKHLLGYTRVLSYGLYFVFYELSMLLGSSYFKRGPRFFTCLFILSRPRFLIKLIPYATAFVLFRLSPTNTTCGLRGLPEILRRHRRRLSPGFVYYGVVLLAGLFLNFRWIPIDRGVAVPAPPPNCATRAQGQRLRSSRKE
jgi:hypothetical protein